MRTPSPPGGSSGMLSPGQTKPLGVSSTPGSFQVNTYFGIFSDFQATLTLCRQKSGVFGVFWPFWVFWGFFCHFLATFGQGYQILDFAKSGVLGVFLKFFLGNFATFWHFLQLFFATFGKGCKILDSRSSSMRTPLPLGDSSGLLSLGQTTPESFQVNTV